MQDNKYPKKQDTRFTRNRSEDISNMLLMSKIPPQAKDLECAVLGAILIESGALIQVTDILKSENFYVDAHAIIWNTFLNISNRFQPIDLYTVIEDLRKNGKLEEVGGAYYLSELTNKVASSANIEYHARIIVQKFIQRDLIRISNDIIRDAYEDTADVFELLNSASNKLLSLNNIKSNNIKSIGQVEDNIRKSLVEKKPMAKSYKLGLDNMDFLSKTFNVVGGYTGTGKTAFMCSVSTNLARQGYRVGIFSIEMSAEMLVARMMQEENSISAKKMITQGLSDDEIERVLGQKRLSDSIFVDDSTDMSDRNILLKVKAFLLKYNLDVVWIDFMQMIEIVESKKLEVRVLETISKGLQNIAKEFDRCVIGLAQLTPTEKNEKPTYRNIRNGGLAEAASEIILLFDEHAKQNDGELWKDIPSERRGKILGIHAKGRYSAVGNINLFFNKPKQTICSWNDKPYDSTLLNYEEKIKTEKKEDIF